MSVEFFIVFVCSILSLIYGGFTIKKILEEPQGSDRMKEIASAIQEGAQAYLNRQYLTISVVGVLIALILFYLMENPFVSCGFVIFCLFYLRLIVVIFLYIRILWNQFKIKKLV